jgi:hypothetical protein
MKIALLILALGVLATANAEGMGSGEAMLSGENQVPTVVTTDMVGMFSANATSKSIKWKLEIFDAVNVTMAHIHLGNSSTNGPPIVYLVPGGNAAKNSTLPMLTPPRSGSNLVFSGTFRATEVGPPLNGTTMADLMNTFMSGETYVNIHTVAYPAGEIRGQVEWQA